MSRVPWKCDITSRTLGVCVDEKNALGGNGANTTVKAHLVVQKLYGPKSLATYQHRLQLVLADHLRFCPTLAASLGHQTHKRDLECALLQSDLDE